MSAASESADGTRGGPGYGWNNCGWGPHRRDGFGRGWKPVELLAMILGFVVFWPIGLAVIGWKFWQRKSQYSGDFASFAEEKWRAATAGFSGGQRWRPFASGNAAFDDWRTTELARMEEERRKLEEAQREFASFVDNLRRAKDREEFERFMGDRARSRGESGPQGPAA